MSDEKTPDGYMKDANGHLVPVEMVKDIDKQRDQTVRELVLQAMDVSAMLNKLKAVAFADVAAFVQLSAEQYEVKVGGTKGNVTLHTFDGRFKIVRQVQETLRFDERLQAAKALIDECFNEWTAPAGPELKVIVNAAFEVNKEGDVSTDRVLALRRHNIRHEKWLRAMDAINDSVQVIGSRSYIRFYERVGNTDRYKAIPLDLASI